MKNNCINGHFYDIWYLNAKTNSVWRKCIHCNYIRKLPKTKEVINEIKKQKIASKELKVLENAFLKEDKNNQLDLLKHNLIGYLRIVLNDINYLSYEEKQTFSSIMKKIKKKGYIKDKKISEDFLGSFIYSLKENNFENLYEAKCEFLEYTKDIVYLESEI